MLSNRASEQTEWQPTWTVFTTPPNFAERWAMRAATRYQRAGLALPISGMILGTMRALEAWIDGDRSEVLILSVVVGAWALFAWHHYAFGRLIARYDAELRDLQTRR